MAKTESTAVNDLIKIATTQTPLRQDPSDDLMFTVPSKKDRSTKQQSALAPRGADVPLPRDRAPHGTQQNAIAMPAIKAGSSAAIAPPPVPRATSTMSSAAISPPPVPRATSTMSSAAISPPPVPRATTPASIAMAPAGGWDAAIEPAPAFLVDETAQVETAPEFLSDSFDALASSSPSASFDSLATPVAIDPVRSRAPSPSPASLASSASPAALDPIVPRAPSPSLATRASLPPPTRPSASAARVPLPSEYPIVSAVHSQPLAPAPQPTLGDSVPAWSADSLDIDVEFKGDSTAQVAKRARAPRTTLEWMIKLAPLAGAMILLGVFVGGYLVFDGQGGTKRTAAAADTTAAAGGTVEVKVVADDADPAAANAAAAAAAVPTSDSPAIAALAADPTAAADTAAGTAADTAAATDTASATDTTAVTATDTAAVAVTPPNLAAKTAAVAVTPPNLAAPTAVAKTAPTSVTAPATTAPATQNITTPAPTAAELARRPVLVDVRIDSKPSGATVTLVDRGKQTFLGTTPISTAVDPSRKYDILFSHPRRPNQTVHLDPKAATRLAVVLGRTGTPSTTTELAKPAAAVTTITKSAAPVAPVTKLATPVTTPATTKAPAVTTKTPAPPATKKPAKIAEPAWDAQIEKAAKIEKAAAPVAKPAKIEPPTATKSEAAPAADKAVGGTGTLMISSKPPCEIHVDGTSTGLMTPQRSLALSAGKHKITLVNPGLKIKKSVAVEITANESTKVIQDLTELMK